MSNDKLAVIQTAQPAMTEANHFDLLLRQAEVLAKSSILPAAYRHKPNDIIAAGLAGRVFGWDVMTSLHNYHVIEGTASLRPEAMLALVRRAGHSVTLSFTNDPRAAVASGKRADNGDEHKATFSTNDAQAAGLIQKKNWTQYKDSMLTWRAVSQLCRVLFPDVVMGAGYVPEELGAPAEVYEDPFADPKMATAEAKRLLLSACGGDKDLARTIWAGWAERNEGETLITEAELDHLLERAGIASENLPLVDAIEVEVVS